MTDETTAAAWVLDRGGLSDLLDLLRSRGYTVLGPTVRDGAIVYDEIDSTAALPRGVGDDQAPGRYRLRRRDDDAWFGFAVGPHSWRRFLSPPRVTLLHADRTHDGFTFRSVGPDPTRYAFVGVRACEIAAMAIQDRVFTGGEHVDPHYRAARDEALVIAVHCGAPASTCFCASAGTGPRATDGFDLALTEIIEPDRHVFVVESGSARGADLLADLPTRPATPSDLAGATAITDRAAANMERALPDVDLHGRLASVPDHPRWDDVASRCLACTSCTLVCPTCFCSTVEDVTDLRGVHAERVRRWDSCFTLEHSYLHGGSVRPDVRSQYRQWLTHKLDTWWDQLGTSGCVGCSRCITWCPVGIDLTVEVAALLDGGVP